MSTLEVVPFTSESDWLQARTRDITSTDVAALFSLSPYLTEFELWHRKRDASVVRLPENERMRWGTRLQNAIAAGVAADRGWKSAPWTDYVRDPEARIGSSFDWRIELPEGGYAIHEIKNVDAHVFRDSWVESSSGSVEAPPHIELQVQHQLELTQYPWAALSALVGGNREVTVIRHRDPEIGAAIRLKVRRFWESVASGQEPRIDWQRDADMVMQLHQQANAGETVTADAELETLIATYSAAQQRIAEAEAQRDEMKARILAKAGTASRVVASIGSLACGMTKPTEGTLITPEMVGTRIGARTGFRQFRFTAKKEKP